MGGIENKFLFIKNLKLISYRYEKFWMPYEVGSTGVIFQSGSCMGVIWELYGSYMGVIWELYGSYMGVVWELYGSNMVVVWE